MTKTLSATTEGCFKITYTLEFIVLESRNFSTRSSVS